MEITVYSKNACPGCVLTKNFLESKGVPFIEKRVDVNDNHMDELVSMGYRSLPVIVTNQTDAFVGYNPSKLQALVEKHDAIS